MGFFRYLHTIFSFNPNLCNNIIYCFLQTFSCVCKCKGTNFSAIHNEYEPYYGCGMVVYANAKVLIFQQFTTVPDGTSGLSALCMQMQRY